MDPLRGCIGRFCVTGAWGAFFLALLSHSPSSMAQSQNVEVLSARVLDRLLADYAQRLSSDLGSALGRRYRKVEVSEDDLNRLAQSFRANSKRPPQESDRIFATFLLELSQGVAAHHATSAATMLEWTCQQLRARSSAGEFTRQWQVAATALLEGMILPDLVLSHLDHLAGDTTSDSWMLLVRARAEEQRLAPGEASSDRRLVAGGRQGPVPRADSTAAGRAIGFFSQAMRHEDVREEANLRRAHVHIGLRQYSTALDLLANTRLTDPSLEYLRNLFRGLALERLNRVEEAMAAYNAALTVGPRAHSGTMALATLLFRQGQGHRPKAYYLIEDLLKDDDPRGDPWWSYYQGNYRFWHRDLQRVRESISK